MSAKSTDGELEFSVSNLNSLRPYMNSLILPDFSVLIHKNEGIMDPLHRVALHPLEIVLH